MKLKKILNKAPNLCLFFSSLFIQGLSLEAAVIPVGAGAYTTDLPAGSAVPSNRNNQPVSPKAGPNFKKPAQTNDWWTSLLWRYNPETAWSENLFAHPFSFKAQAAGIELGYPTSHFVTPMTTVAGGLKVQEYHYPHNRDLLVGLVGLNSPDTKVNDYSDWTVTGYWANGANVMQATIGSGLPFVYITKSGGNALVTLSGNPTIWSNSNGVIGVTVNGHHYGIFAPNGSTWTVSGATLQSSLNGKNYYSVALLPDNTAATLEFFRKHAYAFVTNTQVGWVYDEANSVLKATYTAQTTLQEAGPNNSNLNRPLMALLRHQWLNTSDPVTTYTYASSSGAMKVVDASQFTLNLPYSGTLPFLPNFAQDGVDTYSRSQLYTYIDTLYKQTAAQRWQGTNTGTDTYWMGKNLARIAHLIPIADQVSHSAARDLFIAEVKSRLQTWFDGKTPQVFYYNDTWDTLIGYPASYGSDNQINDHHFHYGYFIMAAAIIANYDSAWASASQWGGMVELLIRDVANWDRTDTRFPFLRNFDIYAGHGWAAGPAAFASGNNEESSSEEVNCINAIIQWGSVTNNKAIRDLGIYLYSNVIASIPQYWFDVNKQVFPSDFQPNTLGIKWSDGGAYAIWWSGTAQEVHGINFLPIQPGMLYLGQYPTYLSANRAFMLSNSGAAHTDVWRDIHMSIMALFDPTSAIQQFNSNLNYAPEAGDSKAHTYHWVHNINQLGALDTTIKANTAHYAVFNKNGKRNYVAYNPTSSPITVTFSDGVNLTVAARNIATSNQVTPPPSNHTFTQQATDAGEVLFSFTPSWTTPSVKLNYQLNGGAQTTVSMTNQNGIWVYTLAGLKNGDSIAYTYTYDDGGVAVTSSSNQHVYQCTGTGGNNPLPPNVIDDTTDYTLSIQNTSGNAQVVFVSKKQSTFVDLHYKINQGGQSNVRMTQSGNTWTYPINNLKNGNVVSFSLTYDVNKAGYDTKQYSYTYQAANQTQASVYPSIQILDQGVTKQDEYLKFWFKPSDSTRFVRVHYQTDKQEIQHAPMYMQENQWEVIIPSQEANIVDYSFSYEDQESIQQTVWEENRLNSKN